MAETPATLRWAVWLLAAQAVGLLAVVAFLVYEDVTAPAGTAPAGLAVIGYAAIMAGLLALLSWSLWRRRAWARGPAIVLQLLLLPTGYYLVTGGLGWLGVPVLAIGLAGAGEFVAPATRAPLEGAPGPAPKLAHCDR